MPLLVAGGALLSLHRRFEREKTASLKKRNLTKTGGLHVEQNYHRCSSVGVGTGTGRMRRGGKDDRGEIAERAGGCLSGNIGSGGDPRGLCGPDDQGEHQDACRRILYLHDKQAVLWKVKGEKHQLPKYVDGKTSRDPEAGEGMKYVLDKKVRLAAGKHTVFFGLPGEPYFTTTEISVKDAGQYVLEFKPGYKYKTSPTRIPTFLKGVSSFEALFTMTADRAQ